MKKILLFLTIALFIPVFSSSQDISFKIITKDKKEYTGVMSKFKIKSGDKKIKIPTENGKLELLSEDLTDIYLWKYSSSKIHLYHSPIKKPRTKTTFFDRKAIWVVNTKSSPKLNLYEGGQIYTIKDSYIEIKSTGQKGFVGILYFFKKPEDESMVFIGDNSAGTMNPNVFLRLMAENYFSDCPSLADKIREKELKLKDKEQIVEYYNNQCK